MVLGRLVVSFRKSNKIDNPRVEICIKMGKHERRKKKNANVHNYIYDWQTTAQGAMQRVSLVSKLVDTLMPYN